MKKSLCILMCVVLAFTAGVSAFAADGRCVGKDNSFIRHIEEFNGRTTSIFSRIFNKLSRPDKIQHAKPLAQSWESVDLDYTQPDNEVEIDAETWVMNELSYESGKAYNDPFNDITLDLILIGNGRKYTVPGFWDGGNTWKIRFICPSEGDWYFKTVCSDSGNDLLNNRTGKVSCKKYSGELDIYKKGFVTTRYGEKYFTYDDGTPFFYLGDTHWSLGDETPEMVETICKKKNRAGLYCFPIRAYWCRLRLYRRNHSG